MSQRAVLLAFSLWVLSCSKPQATEQMLEAPGTASAPRRAPVPSASATTATGPEVLTPEDMEPETEHRITEHNLESELDRLEREIQGE